MLDTSHQRKHGQDRVYGDIEGKGRRVGAVRRHCGAAADRQNRPEKTEDDQKDEGDDIVRDGVEPHAENPERLEDAAVTIVARETAE
jgi:hypothetical protein